MACASQGLTKKALFCCQVHSLLQLGTFVGSCWGRGVRDRWGSEVSGCGRAFRTSKAALQHPVTWLNWETLVTNSRNFRSKRKGYSPVPWSSQGLGDRAEGRLGWLRPHSPPPSVQLTLLVVQVSILYYGGHLVISGQMSSGNLIAFIIYEFVLGDCMEVRGQRGKG